MPADLNRLTEGWLELESDPGLFTLLLEDFGVRGVQVEEVYDLQKTIEGPVFGFIFLFKWIEERRSRRKVTASEESFVEDEETINSIFFAQQMVPNSCATHALLSVLLNCPKIYLGPTLARLKEHTSNMNPENKGYAIGNTPELARAHNSHAKPEPRNLHEKSHGISTGRTVEAFHFVSYVPIGGRLFELDGLKPYPIDHGPCGEDDWTEKFRLVMTERLGIATGGEPYHDIRFNLMAVVPDRRIAYEHKLRTLKTNRQIVLEALQQLVKLTHPELTSDDHAAVVAAMKSKPPSSTEDETTQPYSLDSKQKNPTQNQDRSSPYPKLPAALDSHNYAKSPLMEGKTSGRTDCQPHYEDYSGSEYSDDDTRTTDKEIRVPTPENNSNPSIKSSEGNDSLMAPLSIDTSSDLMKPLSIQTKFETSPAPSASSTDTSSEVGSAFNSPIQSMHSNFSQGSPNSIKSNRTPESIFDDVRDIKKFLVIRMTSGCDSDSQQSKSNANAGQYGNQSNDNGKKNIDQIDTSTEEPPSKKLHTESLSNENNPSNVKCDGVDPKEKDSDDKADKNESADQFSKSGNIISKHPQLIEPHRFAPKDLLALLKTVETEIEGCEDSLFDEIEKRKKYKVDDCRRTHNYDQFICTFLSMLAEQGKLADLVEQQLVVKRRQGVAVGRLHKAKKPDKRRRSRPKKRK
ncbi:ubiquitin carboxyl-terminal hydrolase BAP1 [Trichonephila inaurata madagascariensis]|uniref:Ubiquitin carboxyl-terminal hydrolase n=1 Tax=Trichonephila inaurata madagascariensis TaxID=2747483 RepID=A0A8X7C4M0_9ARAC|nr:ubiquitin carboxyl-terminal hydrolase BAP1 [Trichonephila inaurata madagascariensis]